MGKKELKQGKRPNSTEPRIEVAPAAPAEEVMQEEVLPVEPKPQVESQERKGRIYLKNLVYDTNQSMLKKLCLPFGEIIDISIPLNESTSRPKGFAFVEFKKKTSALKAVNDLQDKMWKGRKIEVSMAVDKRRYLTDLADPKPVVAGAETKMPDDIQIVSANEQPKGKQKPKAEKPKEKTAEELEMEMLDQLVLKNMAEMGGNLSFDEEEEDDAADGKGGEADKSGIKELELKGAEVAEPKAGKKPQKLTGDYKEMLEEVEKEQKLKEKKKRDNEDLSHTCFIRGVSYDTKEKELYKFFKENIGEVVYVRMVKFKADETKHNGNGFVKFQDKKIVDRLIEITAQFNKGEYEPKAMDPKLELNGIRIQFFPSLKKEDAQRIQQEREKELEGKGEPKKKERTNKTLTFEQLIAQDKLGKRRLAFAKVGFFEQVEEDKLNDIDKEQRKRHKLEKMAKMQNPNYFVSEKRVVLKNIDRKLDELELKKLATQILSKRLTEKELKKAKIYSDVKIIPSKNEENSGRSSGIGFIEFYKPEYAVAFLEEVTETQKARKFNPKRWPIIEFAFEDIQILKKINKIRQPSQKKEFKPPVGQEAIDKRNGEDLEAKVRRLQDKEQNQKAKTQAQNDKLYVKLKIQEYTETPAQATKDNVVKLLKMAHGRGLKQRIKKRFPQHFVEERSESAPPAISQKKAKPERAGSQEQKRENLTKRPPNLVRQEEDKILKQIKQRKKQKLRKQETDEVDKLEEQYQQQQLKKTRWSAGQTN